MEIILIIVSIIFIIFGILQIILFFKMWEMTNDVKALKNKFIGVNISSMPEIRTSNHAINPVSSFSIGEIVIYKKTKEKFKIKKRIAENLFECSSLDSQISYTLNGDDLQKSI